LKLNVKMKCANPFFPCEGKSGKIAVIIRSQGTDYEVCEDCWERIGDSNISWGEPSPRLKKVTSPLGTASFRFLHKQ
jgi:hypothetical protein